MGLACLELALAVESKKSDDAKEKVKQMSEMGLGVIVDTIAESIPIAGILFKVIKALSP